MRRRLFTFCSVLSLLLCAAFALLWLRSTRTADLIYRTTAGHRLELRIKRDLLVVREFRNWPVEEPLQWETGKQTVLPQAQLGPTLYWHNPTSSAKVLLDSQGRPTAVTRNPMQISAAMPTRVLFDLHFSGWTLGAALLPAMWLITRGTEQLRSRRQGAPARCLACGYDLRATPDRCPECGRAASTKGVPAAAGR